MKNRNALKNQTMRRISAIAYATTLAVVFMVSLPWLAHGEEVTPPPVPDNIPVPEGNQAFLVGHAIGTQNYVCLPKGSGVAFALFTPQATLFDENGEQLITHFFSPNPDEGGTFIRATWEHSRDTSTIWAKVSTDENGNPTISNDSNFVEQGAVAWVLLEVVGTEDGPTGGDKLSKTTFVQRLNTHGGVAPSTGCLALTDVGNQAFVPYTADYFFYRKHRGKP